MCSPTVDPVNTVVYLDAKGREAESIEAAKHVIALGGNKGELADAYSLYSNIIRDIDGDVEQSLAEAKLALAIDPKTVPPHLEVMGPNASWARCTKPCSNRRG